MSATVNFGFLQYATVTGLKISMDMEAGHYITQMVRSIDPDLCCSLDNE